MDNRLKTFFRSPGWYFLLAVLFAVLSVLVTMRFRLGVPLKVAMMTLNLQWIFWFLVLASGVSVLACINAMLTRLKELGRLPKVFQSLYSDQFQSKWFGIADGLRNAARSFIGQMVIIGAGIMVLVVFLSVSGVIDDLFVDSSLYRLAVALRRVEERSSRSVVFKRTEFIGSPGGHASGVKNIERYKKTVEDLEKAGARVIVVDLRSFLDKYPVMIALRDARTVVFGTDYGITYRIADTSHELALAKGMFSFVPGSSEFRRFMAINRLQPVAPMFKDEEVHDIAIEVLRKYHEYPADLKLQRSGGKLVFGKYNVPVTTDGWVYFRTPFLHMVDGYSIQYPIKPIISMEAANARSDSAWEEARRIEFRDNVFAGKIVVLSEGVSGEQIRSVIAYCVFLENLLREDLITKSELGHLWAALLCVVAGALLVYYFRPIVAILMMLIIALSVLFFCSYLFESHNILVDMFYPLLSIALSIISFPAIAMVHQQDDDRERRTLGRRITMALGVLLIGGILFVSLNRSNGLRAEDVRAAMIDDLNEFARNAHAYREKPVSVGGGGGKYGGITLARIYGSVIDLSRRYTIVSADDDQLIITGVGSIFGGKDSVCVRLKVTPIRNNIEILH